MFDFDPDYNHDKYRKAKFSEADEDRDNLDFTAWDLLSDFRLTFIQEELSNICKRVNAGDRNAMLELIEITANELLVFDTLPLKLRVSLSDSLKKVGNTLRQTRGTKGFLPPFHRERSTEIKRDKDEQALKVAQRVEYRRFYGLNLEEARAAVAEEMDLKEDLIHKYWKKAHRQAKPVFETMAKVFGIVGSATGENLLPTRKKRYGKR